MLRLNARISISAVRGQKSFCGDILGGCRDFSESFDKVTTNQLLASSPSVSEVSKNCGETLVDRVPAYTYADFKVNR